MLTDRGLYQLLIWTSPAYPTGAFSYSHGLEWAVEERTVRDLAGLVDFVDAVLTRGGGWVDAVLFAHAWRAASDGGDGELSVGANAQFAPGSDEARDKALDEVAELGAAFRGTAETALESHQQGAAFLQITSKAWPHPLIDRFAQRHGRSGCVVAHSVVVGLTCAAHEVPLQPALAAYLQGTAANLVSAGVRLIPLGQTQGQLALARLRSTIETVTQQALTTCLDDLGTAAPGLERCSALHETQYTRLFRS
jgi:urease accessory protein